MFVLGVNRRGPRHDEVAQGGRGGEDAVVGELVLARVRRYGDEALDENERVKAKGLGKDFYSNNKRSWPRILTPIGAEQ